MKIVKHIAVILICTLLLGVTADLFKLLFWDRFSLRLWGITDNYGFCWKFFGYLIAGCLLYCWYGLLYCLLLRKIKSVWLLGLIISITGPLTIYLLGILTMGYSGFVVTSGTVNRGMPLFIQGFVLPLYDRCLRRWLKI
jgi:hypothetical protein